MIYSESVILKTVIAVGAVSSTLAIPLPSSLDLTDSFDGPAPASALSLAQTLGAPPTPVILPAISLGQSVEKQESDIHSVNIGENNEQPHGVGFSHQQYHLDDEPEYHGHHHTDDCCIVEPLDYHNPQTHHSDLELELEMAVPVTPGDARGQDKHNIIENMIGIPHLRPMGMPLEAENGEAVRLNVDAPKSDIPPIRMERRQEAKVSSIFPESTLVRRISRTMTTEQATQVMKKLSSEDQEDLAKAFEPLVDKAKKDWRESRENWSKFLKSKSGRILIDFKEYVHALLVLSASHSNLPLNTKNQS
ncbi:uncharacterized protein C8R40DRAFT_1069804 [Lentinula edodes]|uniref:uncharacterized protein n=1 Tax=Lentinula edodes TaxID=5353 RepID=UPI001E8D9672|nr:uncharacterized protein C8R40DRAFT_1069804 [Lentinula edodes]KAH7874887.1 hypothetical protein C8R40DRAFT_1069804 [Lentinula edodes]